jgi:Universal stress protein UspA and related nucleotide-binding proteins
MLPKPNRILIPTDFSETAGHAMRYASDLAQRLGAKLTVVHSDPFSPPIDYTATMGGWDESSFGTLKAQAEEQLERDAESNIDPSVPYDAIVWIAPPLEGILAQARESNADLIVMGTHGRSGVRRLVIGSVTESVMRKAEVPVIAVPATLESKSRIHTIVCPAIYNAQCYDALEFAAAIAPPEARFVILRGRSVDDGIDAADGLAELRAWLPQSIKGRCDLEMFDGRHVAAQIEAFVSRVHADLIVAAEPASRTAADVLHGTLAARLTHSHDCPVLSVNGRTAIRDARTAETEFVLAGH